LRRGSLVLCWKYGKASVFMKGPGLFRNSWTRVGCNPGSYQIAGLLLAVFHRLDEAWKQRNRERVKVVDQFPMAVGDRYRRLRCPLHMERTGEAIQPARNAIRAGSKLIGSSHGRRGQPVEFCQTPGTGNEAK